MINFNELIRKNELEKWIKDTDMNMDFISQNTDGKQ